MKIRYCLVILLSLLAMGLNAQAPSVIYFEHTSIEQGLSQSSVNCMLQDKEGFMWFGTADGLNKFDGYKFTVYNTDPLNPNLLSSGYIQCLYQDHNGIIWVGTLDGGLNAYDPKSLKINRFRHDTKNPNSIPSDNIRAITEYKGELWIGTADAGLGRFDPGKNTFIKERIGSNKISCLYNDNSNRLVVGTEDKGLLSPGNKQLNWNGVSKINCLERVVEGMLIGTDMGMYVMLGNAEITPYKHSDNNPHSISNDQVSSISQDARGNIWISTNGGLNTFNPKNGRFNSWRHDANHPYTLSDDRVLSLFTDRSGKVWVGTVSGGVDAINPPNVVFRSFQNEANDPNSLSFNDISSIIEDHNHDLWIGTLGGGLNLFKPSTESFKAFHKSSRAGSLNSENINCLAEDHNGTIWIGTQDGGLNSFDERDGSFHAYLAGKRSNSLASNTILSLSLEDHDGNIWIGTDTGGVAILNVETREIHQFEEKDKLGALLRKYQVRSFYLDHKDRMWIGTLGGGLFGWDPKTKKLSNYTHSEQKNSLSKNNIFCIYEDINGRLWIGTNEGGLNLFDPESGKFRFFTEHDGIPNNTIYGILEDKGENLWLNTNKGICKFSPPTDTKSATLIQGKAKVNRNNNNSAANQPNKSDFKIRVYDSRDGLPSNQFNLGAYCKTLDGRMYFGSIAGLVTFDADSVKDNGFIPPVVISDFKLFNISVFPGDSFKLLKSPISTTKEIQLKYNQNVISFEFTALNFINPKKNRYAFMLKGFDNGWNYSDAQRRFATYTNLEPGDYTFMVKGSNNDGIWNENGTAIHVVISPPFWKTWWFRILAIVLFGTSVYLVIFLRLRQIQEKEQEKTEINKMLSEARLIALRAQMNPHFIFNSLNSIQQFIYNNNKEEAASYLSKFSRLIRQILEHSSQGTILLQDEVIILSLYLELEALRFQNKFSFNIDVDEDIDPGYTEIPSMLIQPYIENAILHGLVNKEGNGHISINIKADGDNENVLICTIEDDGIGREKAMEINKKKVFKYKNKSMGMSVTNDRLTILNQYQNKNIAVGITDLHDPTGTRVQISIPVDEV
jgi:ligand-binding sensor domain-containing protein/two-component sensor histidine kinase